MRGGLALAAALLCAAPASAQTGVTIAVEGRGAGVAENEIASQIGEHAELAVTDDGPVRVSGRIRGARLTLTATGPDGEITSARFRGRNPGALLRDLREHFWERVGAPIVQATGGSGAPAPSPSAADPEEPSEEAPRETRAAPRARPEAPDEEGAEPEPAPPRRRGTHPDAFRGSVSVGLYTRDFSYVDDLFLELRGYAVPAVPMLRLSTVWHPLAHLSDEIWADLVGLTVDAQLPFGLETQVGDVVYPTHSTEWSMGLRARVPIDEHAVAVSAAYAERAFAIGRFRPDQPRVDVPDVHYHEVRLDAHAWLDLGLLAFVVRGGWSFVVETGQIEQVGWFRRNRSHGAGVGAEVHVPIAEGLNVALLFDWRGYFFDMNVEPGDPRVAGGAIDHHVSTSLGLSYRAR